MSMAQDTGRIESPSRRGTARVTFGRFELDLDTGELARDGQFVPLQARVAKALVHLVQHAGHLVPRRQLIELLWPDRIVEYDQGLNHIIRTLRAVFDDDPQAPRYIETLPRRGYRFIAPVAPAPPTVESAQGPTSHRARGWKVLAPSAVAAVLLLIAAVHLGNRGRSGEPLPRKPGDAVAVLPLEVSAPEGSEAGWVRLGAMDVIAARLRDSGVRATPSETVVAALQATPRRPAARRRAALRRALGAGILVEGKATRVGDGWTIELIAAAGGDDRRRVASEPAEIISAAGRAADLLLAALGQPVRPASGEDKDPAVSEILQRARAATLALELDAARSILTSAPERLRDDPELRHQLAWVEYRAGRLDEAASIATELVRDPGVAARPRLLARALIVRGFAIGSRREDWSAGALDFDAAVAALENEAWAAELAAALAARGVARVAMLDFAAAAEDLGRARVQYTAAGDRIGVAHVDNHFGYLELKRKRPNDALSYFRRAAEVSESFGHVDQLRGNLFGLWNGQVQLLRWSDALATSERLLALGDRIKDPARRHGIGVARTTVLTALGRHREAEAILSELRRSERDDAPFIAFRGDRARAHLAWQQGDPERALRAASRALRLWATGGSTAEPPSEVALLHQRASIAAGRAVPAARTMQTTLQAPGSRETGAASRILEPAERSGIDDDPLYLVAQAEWAAYQGDHVEAERLFRVALDHVEGGAIPATFVRVADAYARWLLGRNRLREAATLAGRAASWAEHDFDSALLQVAVLRAGGQREACVAALRRARRLAGEREISSSSYGAHCHVDEDAVDSHTAG